MKCIDEDCGKVAVTRGLCESHYGKMKKIVQHWDNTLLWEDFEKQGKCLPKGELRKYKLPKRFKTLYNK
jgi:hypothetical protein